MIVKIVEGRYVGMVQESRSKELEKLRARWMRVMVLGGIIRKRDVRKMKGGGGIILRR